MTVTKRVVVGYDASPDAEVALPWAIETAARFDVPLEVVVVGTSMNPAVGHHREKADREATERLDAAKAALASAGVSNGQAELRHGHAPEVLLGMTGSGDLLVVGSTGHGQVAGTLLGSVSNQLVRRASCPVVVVRPPAAPAARRIGVGMDGSGESLAALSWACDRAAHTGEHVVALHGFRGGAHAGDIDGGAFDRRRAEATDRLREWIDAAGQEPAPIHVAAEAIPVSPRQMLVDFSGNGSLLVVGSRGRDALTGTMLGSVSQHLLHHARCPVAVVREAERP